MRYGTGGKVIQWAVGVARRRDYAAIGPVTNLAARLSALAEWEQIVIPEALVELFRDRAAVIDLSPLALRGFRDPVHPYAVIRIESARAVAFGADQP